MAKKTVIGEGKVVTFHYTLRNTAGVVLDSSTDSGPMPYLHGAENIVPGLERQMAGKGPGDKFKAKVPPEEGYGKREGRGPQPVPRASFPAEAEIVAGMQFAAEAPDGEVVPVWVAKVEGDSVFIDRNHPLAGEELHFDVEIVGVREATNDELAHGHPHGADGHEGH